MAKLTFDGVTVPAKTIDTAKVASLLAFHQVSGWNLKQIHAKAEEHEANALMAMAWLSLWEAGQHPDWDRIKDATLGELTPVEEPGDQRPVEADVPDPQTSRADSDPGGEQQLEEQDNEGSTA